METRKELSSNLLNLKHCIAVRFMSEVALTFIESAYTDNPSDNEFRDMTDEYQSKVDRFIKANTIDELVRFIAEDLAYEDDPVSIIGILLEGLVPKEYNESELISEVLGNIS